jgi:hypothetical protein
MGGGGGGREERFVGGGDGKRSGACDVRSGHLGDWQGCPPVGAELARDGGNDVVRSIWIQRLIME